MSAIVERFWLSPKLAVVCASLCSYSTATYLGYYAVTHKISLDYFAQKYEFFFMTTVVICADFCSRLHLRVVLVLILKLRLDAMLPAAELQVRIIFCYFFLRENVHLRYLGKVIKSKEKCNSFDDKHMGRDIFCTESF